MQYAIILAALAALATANPMLEERQTTAPGLTNVLSDISLAANDLTALGKVIASPGANDATYSSSQIVDLVHANSKVYYDVGNGTAAVNGSKTFNEADSDKIGTAVTSTLLPSVTALLNTVVAHQPGIKSSGLEAYVHSILLSQSTQAAQFAGAFVTKVSGPSATSVAPAISTSVGKAFNSALAYFP